MITDRTEGQTATLVWHPALRRIGEVVTNTPEATSLRLTPELERLWEDPDLLVHSLSSRARDLLMRKRILVPGAAAAGARNGLLRRSAEPVVREGDDGVWGIVGAPVWQQPDPDLVVQESLPGLRRGLRRVLESSSTGTAWDWTTRSTVTQGTASVVDHGDLILDPPNDTARSVAERLFAAVSTVIAQGHFPVVVGGDHSIGYPVVSAQAAEHPDLVVVHLDAHADRRAVPPGQTTADCGNFVTWCLTENDAISWVTIGVRGIDTNLVREEGATERVEYLTAADLHADGWADVLSQRCQGRPVHLSIDIDVLDPTYAPEVAYPALGGIDPAQLRAVLEVVHAAGTVVGLDLSEVVGPMTRRNRAAMLAVDLLHRTISRGQH